jgi:hypothetical protein
MEPINYLAQVADPFAQATQGLKLGAGMADLQRQQEARIAQQQQAQLAAQEQARFFSNPNPTMRDAARFASLLSPEQSKAFLPYMEGISKEQQQNTLTSTGQILSALQVNPEVGIVRLRESALAARNSGDEEDATLFEQYAEAAADPQRGPAVVFKALAARTAGIPGAKEFFENIDKSSSTARAEAQAPAELRQKLAVADKAESDAKTALATATNAPERAEAEAALATAQANKAKVEAQFAGPLAQASLNLNAAQIKNINNEIGNRAAKLNLDAQTMQATVAEKLSNIQKNVNEMPGDTRKLVNESAVSAAVAKQSAGQFNDLAKQIEAAGGGYGVFSSASEFLKKGTGFQGGLTQLRNEYTRLRNSAAIKSLPPGPATDADIQLALKPFPPETADARTMASFLRGMAKLQDIDASVANAKTDWLANNNGVLTRARNTFMAGDYNTQPGESFNDFTQRVVQDVSKRYNPATQNPLVEQIPTDRNPRPAAATSSIEAQAEAIIRGGR